jgi:Flp pilus assembly pilin Flp
MAAIARFISAESGIAAVEYGLLLAFIVMATVVAMGALGAAVRDLLYQRIVDEVGRLPH